MKPWILALGCAAAALTAGFAARADDGTEERPQPPREGDAAPDFRLNDHEGRAVRLSRHGKDAWVVLAFFPKAATPG